MSTQPPNTVSHEDPAYQQKMIRVAEALDELRQIYIIGICLSWLIVPLIILIIRYVKYVLALYDLKQGNPNKNFIDGVNFLLISILLNLLSGPMYGTGEWASIMNIASIVLLFLSYTRFEAWSEDLFHATQSPNFHNLKKGWYNMKIATLFHIILIGIFMMPPAMREVSDAIFKEYGRQPNNAQSYRGANYQTDQTQAAAVNNYQYGQTEQPQQPGHPVEYNVNEAPAPPAPAATPAGNTKFCPYCGGALPEPDAKFCANCGQRLE